MRVSVSSFSGIHHLPDAWKAGLAARWLDMESALSIVRSRLPEIPWHNLPLPTLGGRQVWADRLVFADWRVQENVMNGTCRVLDPDDVRRKAGTYAECVRFFHRTKETRALTHGSDHVVVLVHGLMGSKAMYADMKRRLEASGYSVIAVTYPSTRLCLSQHARHLAEVMSHLSDVKYVTFVAYSLGALVVRAALADNGFWRRKIDVRGLFMVAPPSRGALAANVIICNRPVHWLMSGISCDIRPGAAKLPPPDVRYAVIAGGTGTAIGFNPLLPGDNDGVVSVDEARLSDADDIRLIRAPHGLLVNHPETRAALHRFLTGARADNARVS